MTSARPSVRTWCLTAIASALLAAPPGALAQHAGDAVRVNGVGIANERLDRFLVEYLAQKGRNANAIRNPDAYRRYRSEAIDQLVDDELLWQEAVRQKTVATPKEVEAAMAAGRARYRTEDEFARRLERAGITEATYPSWARRETSVKNLITRKIAKGLRVSDQEVHAFYLANPRSFTTPEQVHARHVLVQVESGASAEERARARVQAQEILALARAGGDFADLARERSQDSTAAQGGDLGWVARDRMVQEFEAAAFALGDGEVSDVVETIYGFHVIRSEGRRGGEKVPEAKVREEVRQHLLAEKQKAAVRARVEALRESARIELAEPR